MRHGRRGSVDEMVKWIAELQRMMMMTMMVVEEQTETALFLTSAKEPFFSSIADLADLLTGSAMREEKKR